MDISCPSIIEDIKDLDKEVTRKIRFSLSETGKVDEAAEEEFKRDKSFVYRYSSNSSCLVELDEEPPHEVNKDALRVAVRVAKFLNMNILDNVFFMRKIIINGSNTSGFQRTALVGLNGYLKTQNSDISNSSYNSSNSNNDSNSKKIIKINAISLEEDSARIIEKKEDKTIFGLDRLGIPLIEIATGPNLETPDEVREVAQQIGDILRSFKETKRGLGTIRQDLNVSISKGKRVELKGVQNLDLIPKIVENEVRRQLIMSEIIEEVKKRGVKREDINKIKIVNVTEIFKESSSKVLKNILENNGKIYSIKVPKLKGIIGKEIQSGHRLGTEISDRLKLRFKEIKGLFHRDELPNYGITEEELKSVEKLLNVSFEDNYIIIANKEEVAKKALYFIKEILLKLLFEPQEEVRRIEGYLSKFMRPMPGASRMYPETDVPVINITSKVGNWLLNFPELHFKKLNRLSKKWRIENNKVEYLLSLYNEEEVEELLKFVKIGTMYTIIYEIPKENHLKYNLSFEETKLIFNELSKGNLDKNFITKLLIDKEKDKFINIKEYIKNNLVIVSDEEIIKVIKNIMKENKNAPSGLIIGKTISQFDNKISGKRIVELLNKCQNEEKE